MEHRKLCEAVEKEVGRTLSAPSDFKWLSAQVEKHTHERLSPSTLMRAWGYMEENVVPRKVTLNILARFIGYFGYDDFVAHQSLGNSPTNVTSPTGTNTMSQPIATPSTSWRRWMIWSGVVLAVAFLAVLCWFMFCKPAKPDYVTDIKQLSNNRKYYIHTRNMQRGSLGVVNRHLATTYIHACQNRCQDATPFAIIKHNSA